MSEGKQLWQIRVGVFATRDEMNALIDQIERLLCPDPNHAPPCPVPWSIGYDSEDEMDRSSRELYESLREQYRIESGE
ncbi:SPOR domain-containing protein [Nocardia cyriacigeorgica]|uniref:Uncharacterized protein n=1 Tax=Nocardia cyriacigeorgica TaxID=135487 RepID=A0A5R8P0P5_9NOCA|nr:SPOR domain-containing protein [Nocardia cyriacigeorgica]TLF82444.1 hypothetical protein FEK34_01480 [Nocardia cyriacigeorgica]